MKLAVVLGAGGLVGVAHHAGVMSALSDELGLRDDHVDLYVGTSAGSPIAAYLRCGFDPADLMARVPDLRAAAPGRLGGGAVETIRHGVGSAYVVARAAMRVPSVFSIPPSPSLRRAFPAGVATMGGAPTMLERDLPRTWPAGRLWLATYDLVSRRRVVLGRAGEPYVPLPSAVRASCAIPGLHAPVEAGGGVLVDGGTRSLVNLDLAALGGCDTVICVAPMSYDPDRLPAARDRVLREVPTRLLLASAARLRRDGVHVVLLSPGPKEAAVHGLNMMRSTGLEEVAETAYSETRAHVRQLRRRGRVRTQAA
jgi:NTE family protein